MRTIKKDTLLGLIYNYWYLKASKAPTESGRATENLCHFCRVILGWTFVRWFFCARTMKIVMPWLVALIVAFATVFCLWPEKTKLTLWYILIVIGCAAGFIGLIIGIIYVYNILDRDGEQSKKFLRRKVVGRLPIWFFLAAILLAMGLRFFFVFTACFISILSLYDGAILYLGLKAYKKTDKSGRLIEKIGKLIPTSIREIFGTAWAYLKAKKQKICPQILVELDERNKTQ